MSKNQQAQAAPVASKSRFSKFYAILRRGNEIARAIKERVVNRIRRIQAWKPTITQVTMCILLVGVFLVPNGNGKISTAGTSCISLSRGETRAVKDSLRSGVARKILRHRCD